MKFNYIKLFLIIIITILIGSVPSLFVNQDLTNIIQPPLLPPKIVFPIAWTILYILMGISFYIIYEKTNKISIIYIIQLIINSLWTIVFFGIKERLLSFLMIILIFFLVIIMFIDFYKVSKKAAYLQIPYLLWLIFASYLNLSIYLLNK